MPTALYLSLFFFNFYKYPFALLELPPGILWILLSKISSSKELSLIENIFVCSWLRSLKSSWLALLVKTLTHSLILAIIFGKNGESTLRREEHWMLTVVGLKNEKPRWWKMYLCDFSRNRWLLGSMSYILNTVKYNIVEITRKYDKLKSAVFLYNHGKNLLNILFCWIIVYCNICVYQKDNQDT